MKDGNYLSYIPRRLVLLSPRLSIGCSFSERARASVARLDQSRGHVGSTDVLTGSAAEPIRVAQLEGAGRAHHIRRETSVPNMKANLLKLI
jgi:hypothetical protein